jgi:hypothetical protein
MMRVTREESPSEHWDNCANIHAVEIVSVCYGKNFSIRMRPARFGQ